MKKTLSSILAAVMSCCALAMPSASAVTTGYDMNLDGVTNIADVDTLLTYFSNIQTHQKNLSDEVWANCEAIGDISGDGEIYAMDAALLMTMVVEGAEQGDIDCDGIIEASDAAWILRCASFEAVGKYEEEMMNSVGTLQGWLLARAHTHGDVNGDGIVTLSDAAEALSIYAEFMVTPPIG